MITLSAAPHPLDFAYLAAKRMYWLDEQIACLREIAACLGNPDNPIDLEKALALLSEAGRIINGNAAAFSSRYLHLAVDYESIHRHDLALELLEDAVNYGKNGTPQDWILYLTSIAKIYLDIGESGMCCRLLPKMNRLLRVARLVDFDFGPFPLLLRLGRTGDAVMIATRMDTINRACAFADLAFHDQTSEADREAPSVPICLRHLPPN